MYSTEGSAIVSRDNLLYLEKYNSIKNWRIELGPLEGYFFPYEIIKQIHMDSKISL